MPDIITTLHPENDNETNLYPNIKKENIPNGAIDETKLSESVNNTLDGINTRLSNAIASITQPKYYTSLPTADVGLIVYSDGYIYSWNGTQYVTTNIVYQATQIGNESVAPNNTTFLKDNSINDTSLFEIGGIDSGGNIYSTTNRLRTIDYVKTYYKSVISANYDMIINTYSAGKNRLGGSNAWVRSFTINDNRVKYIKITMRKDDNSDITNENISTLVSSISYYNLSNIFNSEIEFNISLTNLNFLIDNTLKVNTNYELGGIDTSDAHEYTTNSRIRNTIYVVSRSSSVITSNNNKFSFIVFEYDKGNTRIDTAYSYTRNYVVSSNNTRFVRLVVKKEDGTDFTNADILEFANSITYYNTNFFNKNDDDNKLYNFKLLNFGDSIAMANGQYGYHQQLKLKYGMQLESYALYGATMAYVSGHEITDGRLNIINQLEEAINDNIFTPDIILFDGGTNDLQASTLGTITTDFTTTLDTSTFCGSFEYFCKRCKEQYPNAIVIYVRAHDMASRIYTQQVEWGNKAIEICNKYSVLVADVFKDSGMNTNLDGYVGTYTVDATDRTHPNTLGYKKFYVPIIEDAIYKLIK